MSDGVTPDGVVERTRSHTAAEADSVRRHLLDAQGLWIDAHTAAYLARRAGKQAGKQAETPRDLEFIAACARTGRCAFHALPFAQVQPAPDA